MRRTLKKATQESAVVHLPAVSSDLLVDDGDFDADEVTIRPVEAVDLQREFRTRFAWYLRAREWLRVHRVRTHLVSGIEFQMAMFVIGPLLSQIVAVTICAAILLLVFEAAIMYKLWLSSRDFTRSLASIPPPHTRSALG
uniref:hypothetical protein n=1 Tax=Nonomuraea bangladeshensis TaxID=404385 RepID=UPI003F497A6B